MEPGLVISDPSPLQESFLPDSPTGRGAQINEVTASLKAFLQGGPPLHVLLFGRPGSGKTTVARLVLQRVAEETQARTAYINCWENPTLYSVADVLVKELHVLFAERSETVHKLERIRKVLANKRLVLILDEIDRAVLKERDNILYQLLELGNVALICIANSREWLMDLDQRILSRFAPIHLECQPYLAEEVFKILVERASAGLKEGSFDDALLRLISVEADGDARLAISTLRRVAQLAEANKSSTIHTTEVVRAFGEIKLLRRKYHLDRLTPHHRIIVDVIEREPEITSIALWEAYQVECERQCKAPVALRTFESYVARLLQLKLIHSEPKPGDGTTKVFWLP